MSITDLHPGLLEKLTDALRESGYTGITVQHSSSSTTIAGEGHQGSVVVSVTDPAVMLVPDQDGRFTGSLAVSQEPPSMAMKAVAAGVERRGASS
jgi:hypothetical protein